MKPILRRLAATLLTGLVALAGATAQTEAPAWLRIERADRHAENGEYGLAIQLYREALLLDPDNPEALFGMGRAFKAVGDYDIAREYLEQAADRGSDLRVAAVIYPINYELADLFQVRRAFADYQETLLHIVEIAEAEPIPPRTVVADPIALKRLLRQEGLDRVLHLYRIAEDGATQARGDLCELFVGLGRYQPAIEHGLRAVVQQLTTVIEALRGRDPTYEYVSVRETIAAGRNYPEIRDYLAGSRLYRDLYYLGAAFYSEGETQPARELWQVLSTLPDAGQYANRARVQLVHPQAEPLLVPPR